MAKMLTASVGIRGVNRSYDTITVQNLLNNVPQASGGPVPVLKEDGLCGPKTKKAIQTFQLKQFGWSLADGRVDPGGPTHTKLNEFDRPTPTPVPPQSRQLPKSTQFALVRMGSERVVRGLDRDLFFHVIDMTNNLGSVYWLHPLGRPMTRLKPPAGTSFGGSGGRFRVRSPRAIDKLQCPASWISTEQRRTVRSTLLLGFPDGPAQIPMNHHLIGPGGMVGPGTSGAGLTTSISGDFKFIELR